MAKGHTCSCGPNLLPLGLCRPERLQIAPPLEKVVEGSGSVVILGIVPKFASTNWRMPQNVSVATVFLSLNFSPVPAKGSLRHRRSGNRIPTRARDLLVSETVQTVSGAHSASYTIDTEPLSQGLSGRGVTFKHPPPSREEIKNERIYTPSPRLLLY